MEREHNAIMANGKSPKYFVDKYCDQLEKEIEERERLKKGEAERRKREEQNKED